MGKLPVPTTILVVDDEPITMEIVTAMLEDAGYRVISAGDGQACLETAARADIDLILMDVVMPRMNGLDACRRLKKDEKLARIPVVFVTASSDDETLEEAFLAGGRDYVRKPIGRIELLTRIDRVLEQERTLHRLAREEKLKGVLETAGGVCHQLNQPLQYVLGTVQILLMDMDPQDPQYESLKSLNEKVDEMGAITRKLSEITKYHTTDHAGRDILDIDKSTDYDGA